MAGGTFVRQTSQQAGTGTTLAISLSGPPTAGNHLYISTACGLNIATAAPTVSNGGSVLNALADFSDGTGAGSGHIRADYQENIAGGATTVTVKATSSTEITGVISEASGVATSSSLGVVNHGNSSATGTTIQPGSITPTAGSICYTAMEDTGGSTTAGTINSSYTVDEAGGAGSAWDGANQRSGTAHQNNVAAAAVNPTWTVPSCSGRGALIVEFLAAAAGGIPPGLGPDLFTDFSVNPYRTHRPVQHDDLDQGLPYIAQAPGIPVNKAGVVDLSSRRHWHQVRPYHWDEGAQGIPLLSQPTSIPVNRAGELDLPTARIRPARPAWQDDFAQGQPLLGLATSIPVNLPGPFDLPTPRTARPYHYDEGAQGIPLVGILPIPPVVVDLAMPKTARPYHYDEGVQGIPLLSAPTSIPVDRAGILDLPTRRTYQRPAWQEDLDQRLPIVTSGVPVQPPAVAVWELAPLGPRRPVIHDDGNQGPPFTSLLAAMPLLGNFDASPARPRRPAQSDDLDQSLPILAAVPSNSFRVLLDASPQLRQRLSHDQVSNLIILAPVTVPLSSGDWPVPRRGYRLQPLDPSMNLALLNGGMPMRAVDLSVVRSRIRAVSDFVQNVTALLAGFIAPDQRGNIVLATSLPTIGLTEALATVDLAEAQATIILTIQ